MPLLVLPHQPWIYSLQASKQRRYVVAVADARTSQIVALVICLLGSQARQAYANEAIRSLGVLDAAAHCPFGQRPPAPHARSSVFAEVSP